MAATDRGGTQRHASGTQAAADRAAAWTRQGSSVEETGQTSSGRMRRQRHSVGDSMSVHVAADSMSTAARRRQGQSPQPTLQAATHQATAAEPATLQAATHQAALHAHHTSFLQLRLHRRVVPPQRARLALVRTTRRQRRRHRHARTRTAAAHQHAQHAQHVPPIVTAATSSSGRQCMGSEGNAGSRGQAVTDCRATAAERRRATARARSTASTQHRLV